MKIQLHNLIFLILLGCQSHQEEKEKPLSNNQPLESKRIQTPDLKILYRSTGSCLYQVEYNKEGNGEFIWGRSSNRDADVFEIIEIAKKDSFFIESDRLKEITAIMAQLDQSPQISDRLPKDATHIEIFIEGNKRMNAYSNPGNEFFELVKFLSEETVVEFDYSCW